ncbi:ribulose-phosphate 3-epimerase [Nonomuraea sp. NPDC050663]|uniref:ribulose-phosphate 3-epimerase n=1 Tax=Nonomuraea sp. NPDC050663 TaxID=3364370 RepID=UPI0037B197F7
MKSYVSLWSADPLDVGRDIDRVAGHADGFHIDVTDGHLTPQLLFGPDFVAAVRTRTTLPIEAHLMVADADAWVEPFIEAGADVVTVHRRGTGDLAATLDRIGRAGALPGVAVELDEPVTGTAGAKRLLLMGTLIGIKGVDLDERVYGKITEAVGQGGAEVFVDGGIREHTVPLMARAGADGVIPGSLVYGAPDPCARLTWLRGLS